MILFIKYSLIIISFFLFSVCREKKENTIKNEKRYVFNLKKQRFKKKSGNKKVNVKIKGSSPAKHNLLISKKGIKERINFNDKEQKGSKFDRKKNSKFLISWKEFNKKYKTKKPKLSLKGLYVNPTCKTCQKDKWEYLGKGEFDIVQIVRKNLICKVCKKQTNIIKALAINSNYILETQRVKITNKYPYIYPFKNFIVEKGTISDNKNEFKFIVIEEVGSVAYFTLTIL